MKSIAYIAASLDGYIADREGGVAWLEAIPNPDQSDYGFGAFMATVDALLMGANTFRVVQSFGVWPYEKPVYVASNSLQAAPAGYEDRVALVRGDMHGILAGLEEAGHQRIYVDGGQLIQSCLQADLLDELIITHIPVVLGDGIALFARTDRHVQLAHLSTEVVGSGLVKSHYRVVTVPQGAVPG